MATQLPVATDVRHVLETLAAANDDADTVIVTKAELVAALNDASRTWAATATEAVSYQTPFWVNSKAEMLKALFI